MMVRSTSDGAIQSGSLENQQHCSCRLRRCRGATHASKLHSPPETQIVRLCIFFNLHKDITRDFPKVPFPPGSKVISSTLSYVRWHSSSVIFVESHMYKVERSSRDVSLPIPFGTIVCWSIHRNFKCLS